MRTRKPKVYNSFAIADCLEHLRAALDSLREFHAPKVAAKIQRAIKSGDGALRHHRNMEFAARCAARPEGDYSIPQRSPAR